jgi:predicted short-subunit dehydrogenase-like oxidoreductase (DUF2520 family)
MKIRSQTADPEPIGIVGTGRMARALGALLRQAGISIGAVAGRSPRAAKETAEFVGAAAAVKFSDLRLHSRSILVAVADDAVAHVGRELLQRGLTGGVVLHTSAAVGPEALADLRHANNTVGVLHPLQTVPTPARGIEVLPGATYAYAGDDEATKWAQSLIAVLNGTAIAIDREHWQHYHAAAVMACNYQVTLVDSALELMKVAGIGRNSALDALAPLIRATTDNVLQLGPEAALTGPIRRGDAGTVRGHRNALANCSPLTRHLYNTAGVRTIPLASRAGLGVDAAQELADAFEDAGAR